MVRTEWNAVRRSGLPSVVFDHAHGFDREGNRIDGGEADELDLELFLVDFEVAEGPRR